ncbi:hypothetical protein [Chamaesiphon polymorphus]|uniref:Uncharacterized protein n=1 Tax=Chamaesiphon polymorphus CCALA 037 TaxID=2107692 RepID=A0A2T1GCV5_9CYAN|nr:hypothetical protein [Chamaesiphon polymorphus]PSB55230.1 hypothetical protein C7B77_15685 [Chamaesiphon polymorphus CCALA 037]
MEKIKLELIEESSIHNVYTPPISFGSIPSWAIVKTFAQCEELYLNGNDEDDFTQPSLANIESGKILKGMFSCNNLGDWELSERFWFVYKPDLSTTTWFDNKPEELSQSAIVLANPIETIDSIQCYIKFHIDLVIPFSKIANYFEPTDCQIPLPGFNGLTEQTKYSYWQKYIRITDGKLMFFEAYDGSGYACEWFVCQKRDEYKAPVVILYSHSFGSFSFTVFGNCVLTCEQWENIDNCCQ